MTRLLLPVMAIAMGSLVHSAHAMPRASRPLQQSSISPMLGRPIKTSITGTMLATTPATRKSIA